MRRRIHHLTIEKQGNVLLFEHEVFEGETLLLPELKKKRSYNFDSVRRLAEALEAKLTRQSYAPEEELRRLGGEFHDQVLHPEIAERLVREEREDSCLNLKLSGMELAWIPWELLHSGERFLCERFRMGRQVTNLTAEEQERLAERRTTVRSGRGALLLSGDTTGLNAAVELGKVKEALTPRFKTYIRVEQNKKADFLRQELKHDYEVAHFVGHAEYHADDPERTGWRCADGSILSSEGLKSITAPEAIFPLLIFAKCLRIGPCRRDGG